MQYWTFWQRAFLFMFVLLYRVCTHVRLGILEMILFVYICAVVEGMDACKTENFGNEPFLFMFVLLYMVCINVRLRILETSLFVYVFAVVEVMYKCNSGILEMGIFIYVCAVVEGMYTCKTGNFGNKILCLCFCLLLK